MVSLLQNNVINLRKRQRMQSVNALYFVFFYVTALLWMSTVEIFAILTTLNKTRLDEMKIVVLCCM